MGTWSLTPGIRATEARLLSGALNGPQNERPPTPFNGPRELGPEMGLVGRSSKRMHPKGHKLTASGWQSCRPDPILRGLDAEYAID